MLPKNIFNSFTVILLLIASFQNKIYSQERNVYWLHGFGGSSSTWEEMEQYFLNEVDAFTENSSINITYPSKIGVSSASQYLFANLPNDNNSIAICHSMGGVVARHMDRNYSDQFAGIITVGTPNDGAAISNSLDDGSVDDFTNFACRSLTAGPSSVIPGVGVIIRLITPTILCNVLNDQIIGDLLQSQNNESARDQAVGSPIMEELNNGSSGTPIFSIWGEESSPVHWRLISSIDSDKQNDTKWVNIADDFRSFYQDMFITYSAVSIVSGIFSIFNPKLLTVAGNSALSAYQWRRGVKWFDNSEGYWNELIDCASTRTETITVYQSGEVDCDCLHTTGTPDWVECVNEFCDPYPHCSQEPIHYSVEVILNGSSDGFICKDSQIGSIFSRELRARFANHSEATIHQEVKDRIRETLRDQSTVFYTE